MKYLALAALVVSGYTAAQVPNSIYEAERRASYIMHNDGVIRYIPKDYEVVVQPKGFNTAPFAYPKNLLGTLNNRWPLLDTLCKRFPQLSTGGPVQETPAACEQPNYVIRK